MSAALDLAGASAPALRPTTPVVLIAAMSINRVIGREGKLPWRLSSDLKRFRAATLGKPVIVGRKTYEDIGKPLPGRTTVVISSSVPAPAEGLAHARSFEEACALADDVAVRTGASEIVVAGGFSVYSAAMKVASRLLLTFVETRTEGDVFFPEIDLDRWAEASRERLAAGPKDEFATTTFDYRRPMDLALAAIDAPVPRPLTLL
jgi:dihydrofolate reductase